MRSTSFFFFNDTATTEIYTLSLHDALPISEFLLEHARVAVVPGVDFGSDAHVRLSYATSAELIRQGLDRKSTRLNSSHGYISYAVFCLKKKKKKSIRIDTV